MKKLLIVAFILYATNAMASPFLVSDPASGVTFYKITGLPWIDVVPAQADGSLKTDVALSPLGVNNVKVSACISDPTWGEACSADVNFTYTRPAPPAITSNIRLLP
jgi:hypothetical protein